MSETPLLETAVSPGAQALRDRWRRLWRVPERITMSQWAERRRVLSDKTSARTGPWRNAQMPHAAGIMDAISDPAVRKVTMCASTQGGKTEIFINAIGYFNEQSPGPAMLVYPTRDMCSDVLKTRVRPALSMLAADEHDDPSPRGLGSGRGAAAADDDDGTAFFIALSRMNLWATGSNAHSALTSRPIKILLMDEVQHFDDLAPGLVSERTRSFPDYKDVASGNPDTVEGYLWQRYLKSDMRTYRVPCPHCGFYQELVFSRLKWDGGTGASQEKIKQTIRYECHDCGAEVLPAEKGLMLQRGLWVPAGCEVARGEPVRAADYKGQPLTRPRLEGTPKGPRDHAGFNWSQLISPFVPWAELAWEFAHEQRGKPTPAWINNALGQPDSGKGRQLPWEMIRKHFAPVARGGYRSGVVPAGAVCLTAGVDVGDKELWVAVRAWSPGARKSWLIHCDRVPAPREDKARCLAALEDVRRWTFPLADDHAASRFAGDRGMPIWAALLDTGDGERTDELYGWCLAPCPDGCEMIAGKGKSELGPLSHRMTEVFKDAVTREKADRVELPMFWVSNLYHKNRLAGHLWQRAPGESRINAAEEIDDALVERWYWPAWDDDSWHRLYAEHVTNEKLDTVKTREGVKLRWVLKRQGLPNHLWDADCYASAAAVIKGVDRAEIPDDLLGHGE